MLAFQAFPKPHWRKIWSTNLLERDNEEIKPRTREVGIFPNDASISRLVGAVLLEQDEHWQLEGRQMFSAKSMDAIPDLVNHHALLALIASAGQHAGLDRRGDRRNKPWVVQTTPANNTSAIRRKT